jgi:hypothetical protein
MTMTSEKCLPERRFKFSEVYEGLSENHFKRALQNELSDSLTEYAYRNNFVI